MAVKPVEIQPAALAEAAEAAMWYAEHDPRVAVRFAEELEATLMRIAESPGSFPVYLHGTRRVLLARFPYLVVYREEATRILVVAVAHGKRKPGYWGRR